VPVLNTFGHLWHKRRDDGQIRVVEHDFWTSGYSYDEMRRVAPDLYDELAKAKLVIVKVLWFYMNFFLKIFQNLLFILISIETSGRSQLPQTGRRPELAPSDGPENGAARLRTGAAGGPAHHKSRRGGGSERGEGSGGDKKQQGLADQRRFRCDPVQPDHVATD